MRKEMWHCDVKVIVWGICTEVFKKLCANKHDWLILSNGFNFVKCRQSAKHDDLSKRCVTNVWWIVRTFHYIKWWTSIWIFLKLMKIQMEYIKTKDSRNSAEFLRIQTFLFRNFWSLLSKKRWNFWHLISQIKGYRYHKTVQCKNILPNLDLKPKSKFGLFENSAYLSNIRFHSHFLRKIKPDLKFCKFPKINETTLISISWNHTKRKINY